MSNQTLNSGSYRQNLEALRAAQKPSFGTAAYSRHVNRPAGRRVAAFAHRFGVTPNQASAVSATLSASAILLLAVVEPSLPMAVGVAVLLATAYVVDSVDGQLARLRGGGSPAGEWLDHIIDCFKTSALHLAVLISWYRFPPVDDDRVLLVPLAYEVVQVVTFFGLMLMPHLRAAAGTPAPPADRTEHPLRQWLILPTDYGFLCWTFVLMAWPVAFVTAYSALALGSAAMLALALRKWWRELSADSR